MSEKTDLSATELRARRLAEMPRWYSPYGHLAGTLSVGLIAFMIALCMLEDVRWYEALVIPAMFVFANFFEWWAHKHVLHHPRWPFGDLYEKHVPLHHAIYTSRDMAIRDIREFRFVLIPASGVLGIVISAAPLALVIGALLSANAGWLAMMTAALYVTFYELIHLVYHLPPTHPLRRLPFVDRMSRHHRDHHDRGLMGKWNFNVTLALADLFLGTIAPRALIEERKKRQEDQ